MRKLSIHYQKDNIVQELANEILFHMNDNTVIFNVGTDRCIFDVLAPLVGTFLEQSNFGFPVYGTVKHPCHAKNLENRLEEVKVKHPNAKIIGIDACLGDKDMIGEIMCRDYPLHPGKGVGKTLPDVGDASIVAIVDQSIDFEFFNSRSSVRLDFIMDMAKVITDALILAEDTYRQNKIEVAASGF